MLAIRQEHLASVVLNLVDNARRHGAGKPVTVTLSRVVEHDERGERAPALQIDVSDHGGGISEANQARVFDRFFTTERDQGGTGLGLAIVKRIMQGHHGDVELLQTSPAGTTLRVALPLAPT